MVLIVDSAFETNIGDTESVSVLTVAKTENQKFDFKAGVHRCRSRGRLAWTD